MRIIGQDQIADLFGVAPKTIVEWQEAGFPIAVRGGPGVPSEYESESCINWLIGREVRKVQAETPRDRLFRLQAEEMEIKLAKERGQLIPASLLEPALRAVVVAARQMLRQMPVRLAAEMEGTNRTRREELLRAAVDVFLTKLSQWDKYDPEAELDEDDEEGAAR